MTDDQRLNREGKVVLNEEVINRIVFQISFIYFKNQEIYMYIQSEYSVTVTFSKVANHLHLLRDISSI